jgi:hypothetical protein
MPKITSFGFGKVSQVLWVKFRTIRKKIRKSLPNFAYKKLYDHLSVTLQVY